MVVTPLIPQYEITTLIFALLSLTVVRMLPVAMVMIGTRLIPASVIILGWFGLCMLASKVLGLIILEREVHLS